LRIALPSAAPDPSAPGAPSAAAPVLQVKDLAVSFGRGRYPALLGVDFELGAGEVVGLVGESGSGKSMTAFSLMGLLPYGASLDRGTILFMGRDLEALGPRERRLVCGRHMGMVFQEPLTALNPVLTIGEQVSEIFRLRQGRSRAEARAMALDLLAQVGLPNPAQAMEGYPHRFSGGMRQRVVIAMALAQDPELVIADEPTTALDPTIAAQIIRLLETMSRVREATVLFITHNLRILSGLASRILVMYAGLVVEELAGSLDSPLHPYTRGLLQALPPPPSAGAPIRLAPIPGQPPGPADRPPGCAFAPRCAEASGVCRETPPELASLPGGRRVRCHLRRC
jgi:oligopeptide/dipeptide ABC transporter ATP-binding protein